MNKQKVLKMSLLMCMILSAGVAFSKSTVPSYNGDGVPISIKIIISDGQDRGESIRAYISGRSLTVVMPCDLGQVSVEITNDRGDIVHCLSVQTPTGYQLMIPSEGSYVVTFTLQDGSVYYGEFDVE